MESLKNKVIIITGASKGIGRITAIKASGEDPKLVLVSRNKNDLEEMQKELRNSPEHQLLVEADVARVDDCQKIVAEAVSKYKSIDILVNNAAQFGRGKVIDLPVEDFDRIMNTNIRGAFVLTKLVLPHMIKKNEGTIINISSTAGKRGYPGGSAYAASKFALNGFSECLFKEVREHNIRVITISPSSVDTRLKPESEQKKIGKAVYMRMEDVADSIILSMMLPQRAMVKEMELWGTNP
jgi:3-oxoacyl-[acyl-carrier protein] reductase